MIVGTDTYDASDKEDKKKPKAEKPAAAKADIYEASTEEDEPKEEEAEDMGDVAPLPDIFSNKHFFVHANDMTTDEARTLTRYITAFNGLVIACLIAFSYVFFVSCVAVCDM